MYDVQHNVAKDGVPSQPGRYDIANSSLAQGKTLARGVLDQPNFFTRGFSSPIARFEEKKLSAKKKVKLARLKIAARRARRGNECLHE